LLDVLEDGETSDIGNEKSKPVEKLTGAQIVQKKLDEVNAVLKRMDLSKLTKKSLENKT